jgi:hypothetical protein
MAEQVHHIEGVKFPIAFNIPGAHEIGLMYVVKIQRLGEIGILNAFGDVGSLFFTKPSWFNTRLMLRSEGKPRPDLDSSHLMAEVPICAKDSDSRRLLVAMILSLSIWDIREGLL